MNTPFHVVSLKKQSFLQRIFKQMPEDNAIIEVNNLLANKPFADISRSDIDQISSLYRVNTLKIFSKNICEFYAVYLNYCLIDKQLSEEEIANLQQLKGLLNLSDTVTKSIHNTLTATIYKHAINDVIEDGRINESERIFIEKLQTDLHLPKELADKISLEARVGFVKGFLKQAVSDQQLSPTEEEELKLISKSLNIKLDFDKKTTDDLARFKLYWLIDKGDLPIVTTDVSLQKGEFCYFTTSVEWHELRRNVWTGIDAGPVYFTNKRILFMGNGKNTNIKLDKILSIQLHSDGVEIDKDTGKVPILKPNKKDIDIMHRILRRILKEA